MVRRSPGFFGGWLGRGYDPLIVTRDPNAADFGIPELTLQAEVAASAARHPSRAAGPGQPSARRAGTQRRRPGLMDTSSSARSTLLTSTATQQAFDLSQEPLKLRDAYGRNIYGQSVLLARRLIEAGTRMVTLQWAPDANATWDTHGMNFVKLKTELLPQLDASLSTLLDDLAVRGLLDETLIVCMGEFGRSPGINMQAGRDHWPRCYSLLLAGGGVQGGAVHGRSDKIGSDPAENPVTPQDILATCYDLLGIPPETELPDQQGRPVRLVGSGQVIAGDSSLGCPGRAR